MPFKHHEPNRQHIPKAKYRVTNWAEYDRGLVQRGDIRFWIDEEAIKAWIAPYRTTPGGQRKFYNFAIETALILGAVFKLPLRQTEGFVRSLMQMVHSKRDSVAVNFIQTEGHSPKFSKGQRAVSLVNLT